MAFRQIPLTCSGHTRPVVDLAFSDVTPSGFYLISACKDGKPMLRQGDTGDWIGTFEGHKGAVWGATLDKQAERAATAAADFTAKVWNAVTGDEMHTFQHGHIVKSVDFSRDNHHLLTGSNEKILRIFDLAKPEAEPITFTGHESNIKRTIFKPDGRQIISASDDKTLRIWDIASRQMVAQLDFPSAPNDVELSPCGNIMTVSYGTKVSFWNVDNHAKIKEFDMPCEINSATLNLVRSVFVCGGEDFKMYKMDYNTGNELESFKGHFGPVHCTRFSPDGELYASGSEDGTLRLWQTIVGKTYGLWKCVDPDDLDAQVNSQVKAEV